MYIADDPAKRLLFLWSASHRDKVLADGSTILEEEDAKDGE